MERREKENGRRKRRKKWKTKRGEGLANKASWWYLLFYLASPEASSEGGLHSDKDLLLRIPTVSHKVRWR